MKNVFSSRLKTTAMRGSLAVLRCYWSLWVVA